MCIYRPQILYDIANIANIDQNQAIQSKAGNCFFHDFKLAISTFVNLSETT